MVDTALTAVHGTERKKVVAANIMALRRGGVCLRACSAVLTQLLVRCSRRVIGRWEGGKHAGSVTQSAITQY